MEITKVSREINQMAHEKGWWDEDNPRSFGDVCMMIVTEVAEAVEHYRNNKGINQTWYQNGKPDGVPIEFADIAIRLFDAAYEYDIDLEGAIIEKMNYNSTRSHRHGKKLI